MQEGGVFGVDMQPVTWQKLSFGQEFEKWPGTRQLSQMFLEQTKLNLSLRLLLKLVTMGQPMLGITERTFLVAINWCMAFLL